MGEIDAKLKSKSSFQKDFFVISVIYLILLGCQDFKNLLTKWLFSFNETGHIFILKIQNLMLIPKYLIFITK